MIDFDASLRSKLQELEAAVPEVAMPVVADPRIAPMHTAPPKTHRFNRRRQGLVLLAAVVAMLGATAVVVVSAPDPVIQARAEAAAAADQARVTTAEQQILDDLGAQFAGACFSLEDGRALVRSRLDALGYKDWTIETRDGAENAQCVGGAGSGLRTIYLIPSMGGPVGTAMEALRADLMTRCLNHEDAAALVSSTLTRLGARGWTIATDTREEVSLDQEQAFEKHLAAGCWVYTRSESHPDGGRTFYITGR